MPQNNNSRARHRETVEKVVVTLTALALNCPSTYTIAWSKNQHTEDLPILYAGIGSSLVTAAGALINDKLMWAGLISSMALFGYTVFFYRSPNSQAPPPLIIGDSAPTQILPEVKII